MSCRRNYFYTGQKALCLKELQRKNITNVFNVCNIFYFLSISRFRYDLVTILEDVNRELSAKKAKYRSGDVNAVSTFVSCLRGPIFFQ